MASLNLGSRSTPASALSPSPEAIARWIAPTPKGRAQQLDRFRQAKRRMLENIPENRKKHRRYQRDEFRMVISPTDIIELYVVAQNTLTLWLLENRRKTEAA